MNFREMLISNARKAMLDNIEALDKKTLQKELKKSLQEQFRLNNIIEELERHLYQEILEWQDDDDEWIKAQVQEDKVILDKLKELKEEKIKRSNQWKK